MTYGRDVLNDRLPDLHGFEVHVIGDGAARGKCSGWAHLAELAPWGLRFEARLVDGRLVLTLLTIELDPTDALRSGGAPSYPARGIGADLIARIRVGALLEAIHAELIESKSALRDLFTENASADDHRLFSDALALAEQVTEDAKPHKRGNPGFTDTYLRRVAEVRLEVQDEGLRPITAAVAHRLELPSAERARDHVNAATKAGWLMKGTEGRSARLPGPKLLAAREANTARAQLDSEEGHR